VQQQQRRAAAGAVRAGVAGSREDRAVEGKRLEVRGRDLKRGAEGGGERGGGRHQPKLEVLTKEANVCARVAPASEHQGAGGGGGEVAAADWRARRLELPEQRRQLEDGPRPQPLHLGSLCVRRLFQGAGPRRQPPPRSRGGCAPPGRGSPGRGRARARRLAWRRRLVALRSLQRLRDGDLCCGRRLPLLVRLPRLAAAELRVGLAVLDVQADGRGEVTPCRLEQHDRLLGRKASDLGQSVQRGLVAVAFKDVSAAGRDVGGAVVLAVSRREDEHRGRISAALGRAHVPEQSIRVVHDPSRPGCILWRDGSRQLIRGDCPLHLEECLHGRGHRSLRLRHEEALHLAREFSRQPLVLLHSWEGQECRRCRRRASCCGWETS